jgi:peptide/nickel transport system substrate-binding protein
VHRTASGATLGRSGPGRTTGDTKPGAARPLRRKFWRTAAPAALLGGALLVSGIAAAGASGIAAAGASVAGSAKAAASSSSLLIIGSQVAPPTLDPTANAAQAIDEVIDYNVLQHLVELAPDGALVPTLATSWTTSAGNSVYTFTLRKDVKFSNGDPLTPADVVFSMRRVTADKYPYYTIFDVKSVKALHGDRVQVTLDEPDWNFLFDLAAYSNGVILDPKAVSSLATDPIGTGPYTVEGQTPNYSVTLKTNPSYWGSAPDVSGVEFRYFSDPNALNAALESGGINVIDNLATPSDLGTFTSDPSKYVVISGLTNGKVQLTINNTSGPFASKLVRQAVEYAIDKQAIIKVAAAGQSIPIGSDTVPADPYYLDLANLYPYDPSKAKQLLSQAGYPNGFSTTLTLPPYYYATLAGPVIQSELDAVGIKTTITNVQWPLWLSQVFEGGNFDLTIIDHAEARDVANYATPGYYWHFAGVKHVASLLSAAEAAPTQGQWIAGTQQVLRLIAADAVNDWLYVLPAMSVHDVGVIGLPKYGYTEAFDLSHVSFGGTLPASLVSLGYSTK